jgi:hypothetical protein
MADDTRTTTDQRLDELSARIDRLEANAQAAGAEADESIKGRVHALRRLEASARAAERAGDRARFSDAMQAFVEAANELPDQLSAYGGALADDYRDAAEADARDLRRGREAAAERLGRLRETPGDRGREKPGT